MVKDEIASLERAARLPINDITTPAMFLPAIHRQMLERYGDFQQPYLSSQYRRTHPQLGVAAAETQPAGVAMSIRDDSAANSFQRRKRLHGVVCRRVEATTLDLTILTIADPHIMERPAHHFEYGHPSLDGLALHREGVHVKDQIVEVDICGECHSAIHSVPAKLPALALANDNIRGFLPDDLQDVTWLEERLCAKYLASAYIVRLYDLTAPGAPEERPRVMKGHACSFPLNTVSTAAKLPWPVDGNAALLSCIVIGPRKPRMNDLRNVFKVRRDKVKGLLLYLKDHCKGYPQVSVDDDALRSLPEDDVPELIMRHVQYQTHNEVPSLFAKETAGLDVHPAELGDNDDDDLQARTFLEHHGLLDINGISVPAHTRAAAALANATGTERPDLIIRHGTTFIEDYNNPDLFPGMFPTLFPWGTGGFEQKSRRTALSFGHQAKYLLDLSEPLFRRHWSYIFVVANIKQRRAIHLGSRLMCKSQDFARFSSLLQNLNPDVVQRVAEHVAKGGSLATLSGDEVQIFSLLKKCELVSANVPGSKAVMTRARADIRAYIGRYGIFQLFLTLNPGPSHSPVFQIFFGDRSVTLNCQAPTLPTSKVRASRVADDPVAASDYFHFHINAVFQYLLGWDIRKKTSTAAGGLFGRLAAFYLVKEHSMRGQLHCHSLIWLEGGLNPSTLRARMQSDEEFQNRYLQFFDELLRHGYPSSDVQQEGPQSTGRKPRQECPPRPADPQYPEQFELDHSLLAHEVQRHRCTFTCFKGGRDSCRFLFPHDVVKDSSFNPDDNSISLRIQHPLINWHNPNLLVATRHNHDLKAVQSGKSGAAAASYITSYTTKSEETPANQISMINSVYERLASTDTHFPDTQSLLSKCVMQFGRERQVHAQQASTYVRDLGDTEQSHTTTPMLSGALTRMVHKLFGFPREDIGIEHCHQPGASPMDIDEASSTSNPDVNVPDDNGSSDMVSLNHHGLTHQVQDYLWRGTTLADLCFYDFVQYVELIRIPKTPNHNHHHLGDMHPNHATHLHRYTPLRSRGIPRSIGASFPRRDGSDGHGDMYCSVMMAHFIPFDNHQPLKLGTERWEEAFRRISFSLRATHTMDNWAALLECDDARDADQLRRRKAEARTSMRVDATVAALGPGIDNTNADVDMDLLQTGRQHSSAETIKFTSTLERGGWFDVRPSTSDPAETQPHPNIEFSRTVRPNVRRSPRREQYDVGSVNIVQ
ncbi:unnamed protein product [Tilletia caries]|nr:unnamed protein product [Tilletia caries]